MNNHLQWLINNKQFLSISKIEKQLNMPSGTLAKFVADQRGLDDQWHVVVIDWIRKFKK